MWPSFIEHISDPVRIRREETRTWLAYASIALIAAVSITMTIWSLARNVSIDSLVAGVFTPLIGITGTIIGFYFAGEKTR
jgi:hypothetical protein